ncbi:tyrosine-type recombinase/integrase [Pseudonocardia sp. KRD291]|uniref:tyrosine-type recombinase/integrase n=1 Tax=Pseudonocardia sp. KRD291 TaxID=2792007 RepID=UPI0027E2485D|nr:tyrosine-type recombinase/integrase [Pseudonocardia sp. KRD291]
MAKAKVARSGRQHGSIDELPSGALRVRVYAGVDPVTKRRHDLIEVVPPGPNAERTARDVRDRLLREVAERRNPRTSATVDQLLERYLDQFDGAPNTLTLYRGYVRNHIAPFLGHLKVGQVDAEILDSFYAELRRCRTHCTSRRQVDHRTAGPHECDDRCGPHRCRPLSPTTVRHMHFILSGAFKRAVRWRWVSVSPIGQAEPPAMPKPNPEPPSPAEAARILSEAWRDPSWGALLWVAMTTGVRRGELCAIRWSSVNLDPERPVIWLRRAIRKDSDGRLVEAELKTHQQRRIALDAETVAVLVEHRTRCEQDAAALGLELRAEAFVFSPSPDGSEFPKPDSVTQRYERLAVRLGIHTTIHKLRHYSATELISGGVDIRTVAGRLGHGGGGTTTLRTYTAWVAEADQRAAVGIGAGMPARPGPGDEARRARADPRHPYEKVAAVIADCIYRGQLAAGQPLPAAPELAEAHEVALSTARRAIVLLKSWGLVVDGTSRPLVAALGASAAPGPAAPAPRAVPTAEYWAVTLRGPGGHRFPQRIVTGSLADPGGFRGHLLAIARIEDPENTDVGDDWIGNYEIEAVPIDAAGKQPIVLRW